MRVELTYADSRQAVEVPDKNLLGILHPNQVKPVQDTESELKKAAEHCTGFVGDSHRVLVLINDYTRPTPSHLVLAALEPGLAGKDARFVVCTGTHRDPTENESRTLFGSGFYDRHKERILVHACRDKPKLFFAGKTSFGTDVWFNIELLWAEKVITINSVEPHYFAGYTGGRKGFLPGIAGLETIVANHNNDNVTSPKAAALLTEGNPIHADMTAAAKMVPRPVFSIQIVLDRDRRPFSVFHGDLFETFNTATQDSYRVYAVPIQQRADIVLSVMQPPNDINFYQSQKAVEFAKFALKEPGVQITASACRNGIGDDGFIRTLSKCTRPDEVLGFPMPDRILGWHKSARLARIMQSTKLLAVTGIADEPVKQAFIRPFGSIQAALDAALERVGPSASVYVVPDAGKVIPVLKA